jgi:cytochrome P450
MPFTPVHHPDLDRLNLFGPAFKSNPYPTYAHLREVAPVYRRANARGGICFITRYAEVAAALRDHRHFVKDIHNTYSAGEQAALPPTPPLMRLLSHHMLNSDVPDHTRLRALVNKAFTVRMVEQLHTRIESVAHQLLDRVSSQGAMDLIADFALPLPIIVIAEMLGIPTHDHHRFRAWSNALVSPSADQSRNEKKFAKARQLMEDFTNYLRVIFAARRATPRDDLITSLLHAEEAGDMLGEEELFSMVLLLIVVGHETTVNLIGNGVLALLQQPEQYQLLQKNPTLLPGAVEEILRYDCPVERAPMRFAACDLELCGQTIYRGDAVSLVLGAANRDPALFPNPDTFDITRTDNRHLAFGAGIHYCLGAALARAEGRIALQALMQRLPALRLGVPADELRWRPHPIMRGLHKLPLRWG